jgi:predicted nucleic acid-binding protein
VTRASAAPAGTLVLDSQGLAKAVLRVREVTQWLALARADDLRVITSAATVVEVAHPRLSRPALEWTLSRIVVEPVTESIARRAAAILAEASLHGHRHAIDAMLSATALTAPGPVTVLTSDPEDFATLCGRDVTVIKVLRDDDGGSPFASISVIRHRPTMLALSDMRRDIRLWSRLSLVVGSRPVSRGCAEAGLLALAGSSSSA